MNGTPPSPIDSPRPAGSPAAARERLAGLAWLAGLVLLPLLVHLPVVIGDQTLYFNDVTELQVPIHSFFARAWAEGRFPLWAPDIYLGFPLFAEGQAGPLYPPNWLLFTLLPTWWAVGLSFSLHLSFAAVGTGLFLRRFVGWPAAFAGGVAFSLTGYLAMHHMHLNLVQATAWLPWGLWAVERLFLHGRLRDVVLLAVIGGAMAMCGHPQSTVQGLGTFGLWGFVRALGGSSWDVAAGARLRGLGAVALAIALAGGLWMIHVLPILQLASGSLRAAGTPTDAQMAAHESLQSLASAVVPSAFGTTGNATFWLRPGGTYRQGPEFFLGAATAFLGLLALGIRRDRWTLALAACGFLATLVVMGPLTLGVPSLYRLPFLQGLRFPNRLDGAVSLFAAALAAAGLEAAISGRVRARHAGLAAGIVASGTLAILLLTYRDGFKPGNPLADELLRDGTVAAAALLGATAGVLLAPRFRAIGLSLVLAAVALPVADFGIRQVPATDPGYWDEPDTARAIRNAACPDSPCSPEARLGRVVFRDAPKPYLATGWLRFSLPPSPLEGLVFSVPMVYGLPAVDGMFPLLQTDFLGVYRALHDKPRRSLGALGGRWIVTPKSESVPRDAIPILPDAPVKVFEDPAALPRAFAVHGIEKVADPAKAIDRLAGGDILRTTAIVESFPPIALDAPPPGTSSRVVVDRHEDERVLLDADMAADALVVLLDAYADGWIATVDGVPAPILRADRLFRAVPVPGGLHRVEFLYRPAPVYLGGAVSAAILAVLLALLAAEAFACARRGRVPAFLSVPVLQTPDEPRGDRIVLTLLLTALATWTVLSVILRWEGWRRVFESYGG